MEKKSNYIWLAFQLFGVIFGACALFFGVVFAFLIRFSFINENTSQWFWLSPSLLLAVVLLCIVLTKNTKAKKMKLSLWISTHMGFVHLYALPLLFLTSISPNIVSTNDAMQETISLSWNIYGITIAIFLFWYLFLPEYLEKKKPDFQKYKAHQGWEKMQAQGKFYEKVSIYFHAPALVAANLIMLIVATTMIYMSTKGLTIWNQNIARFSYYLCIETLFLLFWDILKPFFEKRDELLKEATVSEEDVDSFAEAEKKREKAAELAQLVDEIPGLSEKQKKEMKKAIAKKHHIPENVAAKK